MPCTRADRTSAEFTDQGEPVPLDELLLSGQPHAEDFDDADSDDSHRAPGLLTDAVGSGVHPAEFDPTLDDAQPVLKRSAKRGRPKGSPNQAPTEPPPPTVDASGAPLSVYQRLVEYDLLRKITDIVLAKVAIPWHLRADAAQELHATWATLTAKPEYQRNQLAHYAYKSGQHAALKLRRTIGAVVVIPGALFRTGRDTAFMEAIGAAVNPRDVEDYKDSLDLSVEPPEDISRMLVSHSLFEERFRALNLSAKQLRVARMALIERKGADDIAMELGTQLVYIERMLNQVTKRLLEQDFRGKRDELPGLEKVSAPPKQDRQPKASRESAEVEDDEEDASLWGEGVAEPAWLRPVLRGKLKPKAKPGRKSRKNRESL